MIKKLFRSCFAIITISAEMTNWTQGSWDDCDDDGAATNLRRPIDDVPLVNRETHATRAEQLTYKAPRVLREVAIDFGMQFEQERRHRIENLVKKLQFCLAQADDPAIESVSRELMDEVYEMNRAAYLCDIDDDDDAASAGVVQRR